MKRIKRVRRLSLIMLLIAMSMFMTSFASANTDGTEPQITDQPDILILELGADWAGTEFELTTDEGLFPIPITVNEYGVLSMELGGSKTYSLSLVSKELSEESASDDDVPKTASPAETGEPDLSNESSDGIPVMHMVFFIGGLAVAAGGLIAMYIVKRRRVYYDADYDEYGEDEQ